MSSGTIVVFVQIDRWPVNPGLQKGVARGLSDDVVLWLEKFIHRD